MSKFPVPLCSNEQFPFLNGFEKSGEIEGERKSGIWIELACEMNLTAVCTDVLMYSHLQYYVIWFIVKDASGKRDQTQATRVQHVHCTKWLNSKSSNKKYSRSHRALLLISLMLTSTWLIRLSDKKWKEKTEECSSWTYIDSMIVCRVDLKLTL